MTDPPKPNRRRFQFRLRTLMVFVTLCAIACSWLTTWVRRAERQRKAVEAIRAANGLVKYDYEYDADGKAIKSPEPPGPAWLLNMLGVDFFSDVEFVSFFFTDATDDDLEHLEGLSDLRELWLAHTQVTDRGLEHLRELTNLQELYLWRTRVTDAGLEHLRGLTMLQALRH